MIIVRTPHRCSLLGGGTDVGAWLDTEDGVVIGGSINRYSYVSVRRLEPFHSYRHRFVYSEIETVDRLEEVRHRAIKACLQLVDWPEGEGVEIFHQADLPSRSGTGSSSAFVVGLLNGLYGLQGKRASPERLATEAIHVEQTLMGEAVGSQDQTLASFGGFNLLRFSRKGNGVYPLCLRPGLLADLEKNLLLFFTKMERTSSDVAKGYYPSLGDHKQEMYAMVRLAEEGVGAVEGGDWRELGSLMDRSWRIKSSFSGVSNPKLSGMYADARLAGAYGGKVTGAGGGGCLLLAAPPDRHEQIKAALPSCVHIPFAFEHAGSQAIFFERGKR